MRPTSPGIVPAGVVALAAVVGLALTGLGLAGLPWPEAIPWVSGGGALRVSVFAVVVALAVEGVSRVLGIAPFAAGACVLLLAAVLAGHVWPVAVVSAIAAACAVGGRVALARLGSEPAGWLVCGVVGAGAYGTAIGLLAYFPVNYASLYGVAVALPLLAARRTAAALASAVRDAARPAAVPAGAVRAQDVALATLGVLYGVVAMMPEIGHDALALHLFIPIHVAAMHRWAFDAATYTWAVIPLLADWLFCLANMLAGEAAARLVNVASTLALAGLVRDLAGWAGATPGAARWAALIFLSSPLTFTETASLFVEAPWAMFVATGVLALARLGGDGMRDRSWLVAAGLAVGFAFAVKAVTLALVPPLLAVALVQRRSWATRTSARTAGTALALLLIVGSVPYVTAWWVTGNPVFPFFNSVFRSPFWTPTDLADTRWARGVAWDLPYRLTFETHAYMESSPGAAGFQWLLVALPGGVALAMVRNRRGLALFALAVASLVLCFRGTAYLRYVFPVYAIFAAAIAPALDANAGAPAAAARALRALAALAVALNMAFLSAGPFVYRDFPLSTLLGRAERDRYVERRMPMRRVVETVDALNRARAPVVVIADPLGAGLATDVLYTNWYSRPWTLAFAGARDEGEMTGLLERYGVEYVILDDAYPFPGRAVELLRATTQRVDRLGTLQVRRFRPRAGAGP